VEGSLINKADIKVLEQLFSQEDIEKLKTGQHESVVLYHEEVLEDDTLK